MGKASQKLLPSAHNPLVPWALLALILAAGCHHAMLVDTGPLDDAGMSYDSIQEAKSLNITATEVAEIAKARQGGLSDANCVKMLRIFRAKGQSFTDGGTIAGLIRAGIDEPTVLELASLNQLGFASGELQAMRLAGLSNETILEVARHHAEGTSVLSGASLAGLKNAGLRDSTLLELSRRGVPDSEAAAIIALRRRGSNDQEILRHFTGS